VARGVRRRHARRDLDYRHRRLLRRHRRAFFKTNVAVGFLVLATVLCARMASGGF
jgi:hypothetical protein